MPVSCINQIKKTKCPSSTKKISVKIICIICVNCLGNTANNLLAHIHSQEKLHLVSMDK